MLQLIFSSLLNFQSTLDCLCLEVNIFISYETKIKFQPFFFFFFNEPQLQSRVFYNEERSNGCHNHIVYFRKSVTGSDLWKKEHLRKLKLNIFSTNLSFQCSKLTTSLWGNFQTTVKSPNHFCLPFPISVALCNPVWSYSYLKLMLKISGVIKKKKKNGKK